MTRAELVRKFLVACHDQYRRSEEMPDMVRRSWLTAFEDIPIDRLSRAMEHCLATSKFFPLPADVREIARLLPQFPGEIEAFEQRRQAKLLTRIDWHPKLLVSYRDSTEERLKLAAPSEEVAASLVKEALERRPLRQLTDEQLAARLAELERQRKLLQSQAHVTDLRIETERVITRAVDEGAK